MITLSRRYQENKQLLKICKIISNILLTILAAYCFVSLVFFKYNVSGTSMQPVIENHDTILVNRLSYIVFSPGRYDIVAFNKDGHQSERLYIRRVIGIPGDKIQIKDGKVYVNGSMLEDDKYDGYILTAGIASNEITLGKDEYFLLGDNRNSSEDSRFASIGVVNKKSISGKVWSIISPIKRIKFL